MTRRIDPDAVARARLAFISASQPAVSGPQHAKPEVLDDKPDPPAAPADPGWWVRWRERFALTGRQMVVLSLLLILGVGFGLTTWVTSVARPVNVPVHVKHSQSRPSNAAPAPSPAPSSSPPTVKVHVMGGVKKPGVVTLPEGAIVQDALSAAGGMSPNADPGDLNLAAPVAHGQQIVVGQKGRSPSQIRGGGDTPGSSSGGKVNLNTATQADLEKLPGVGPVMAAAILEWRKTHGKFRSVKDLQEVSGIGPKSFEKLQALVSV